MQEMQKEDARALLQSTQQLRTHWSSVIVNLINYVIILNVAVWSFFLKAYIDKTKPSYIVLASFLSSLSVFLWRVYTHYLDDHIAALYPDFLLYEKVLGVPYAHGTKKYLLKAAPLLKCIFLSHHLNPDTELYAVSELARRKRIGCRGHNVIDFIAFAFIVLMFFLSVKFRSNSIPEVLWRFDIAYYVVILVGTTILWLFYFQKDPREEDIEDAIEAATRSSGP